MTFTEAARHASPEAVAIAVGLAFNRVYGGREGTRLMNLAQEAQRNTATMPQQDAQAASD